MVKLTPAQNRILNAIVAFQNQHGFPPTLEELGGIVNITTRRGVSIHLKALAKKGFIKRGVSARSIKVLREADEVLNEDVVSIPLVGQIAAGSPILAEQSIEGYFPVQKWLINKRRDCFLLRVRGDSMDRAHILDNDLIIVQPQNQATSGEIVAALINDEATVKRFVDRNGNFYLVPESSNQNHRPIEINENVLIQGKVLGVIRDLGEVINYG